jgi:hypothetical protein
MVIPPVEFELIQGRIDRLCDPYARNPQIAVFGSTGSGKSHIIRYGLLPIRPLARTLVIDVKGLHSRTWDEYGTPVTELPAGFFGNGTGPTRAQYRLIVEQDRESAQIQLRQVFAQIRSEGHCRVILDESRRVTEREQLSLGSAVEDLISTGRESGITLILGAQSVAYAVPSLKDQPAAMLIGAGQGKVPRYASELAQMAGYGKEIISVFQQIRQRQFLYIDTWESGIIGMTEMRG